MTHKWYVDNWDIMDVSYSFLQSLFSKCHCLITFVTLTASIPVVRNKVLSRVSPMYHLDLVQCQGDENLLISCPHRRIYNNYYYCRENAEVMCNSKF